MVIPYSSDYLKTQVFMKSNLIELGEIILMVFKASSMKMLINMKNIKY